MISVLVVYDSRTGNTERMAHAVGEGAKTVKGTKAVVTKVDDAKISDLVDSDAIMIGSPTYYGNMSGKLKSFIDKSYGIHGKLVGKVGGAFTSSDDTASGAEATLLSILKAMLIHGMIIQGRHDIKCFGPTAVQSPNEEEIKSCNELGKRVANLAAALAK
jgi:NAD(P)H dehydrogenase (quinone)